MRVRTLISVEPGDQTSIKHFLETCNLLGLYWRIDETNDEQTAKVFRMIKVNEFTLAEAEYAVAYAVRIAREKMATAFEPTGICFAHGEEQEKRFQQDRHDQARYCIERAEWFLETLHEDISEANIEQIRPPAPPKSQRKIAPEDRLTA